MVPDALNYPDLLGPEGASFLYRPGSFGTRLVEVVSDIDLWRERAAPLAAGLQRFDWSVMGPIYDDRLVALAAT